MHEAAFVVQKKCFYIESLETSLYVAQLVVYGTFFGPQGLIYKITDRICNKIKFLLFMEM